MDLRCLPILWFAFCASAVAQGIGEERAIEHLADGDEFGPEVSLKALLKHGERLFSSKWTRQDGAGRPLLKGSGAPLSDTGDPLAFPRNFNRISSPEASSCFGCHNDPLKGGGGEFLTNAFVLGERFDYATFDPNDVVPTKGAVDEFGGGVHGETIANIRSTPSLFGAGYVELLAREITFDLQAIRNSLAPGGSAALTSKGIDFGDLSRDGAGAWMTDAVEGLPRQSVASTGPSDPPTLIIHPFSHAGVTISLRQFTNSAFNHHIGVQSAERAGDGFDADGDGFLDELSRADITAVTLFRAVLPPPGRVIEKNDAVQAAILRGEQLFIDIQCASCHVPCLPLDDDEFLEPNPFNPPGNVQEGGLYQSQFGSYAVDLSNKKHLPAPRLKSKGGKPVEVFAFTDFKLHDITSGPSDPNREPLDMLADPLDPNSGFFEGNGEFLTARLWGAASTMPYFHHGKFTTLREAVEAHAGEAAGVMASYNALPDEDQDAIIEFLKSLRVLPEGAKSLTVNNKGKKIKWPDMDWECGADVPPLPPAPTGN